MVGLNLKIPYHYLLKPEASLGMSCLNQLRSHYMSKPPSVSLSWTDPFADATKGDDLVPSGTEDKIHIRIQQRNGRKTLTTVQGIGIDYDKKKLVKAFKKVTIALVLLVWIGTIIILRWSGLVLL